MKKADLTNKEKIMLYGLTNYPNLTDKELSKKLNLKHSTVTSIRHRLREKEYFRKLNIPQLQKIIYISHQQNFYFYVYLNTQFLVLKLKVDFHNLYNYLGLKT